MFNIDRHIAISAGWVAGPAFGVAMMAAPEYLHLGPIASALLFWGGIIIFLATIAVVVIVSIHEEGRRKAVLGPIAMMALGALIFCGGAAWYFWPAKSQTKTASEPEKNLPRIEDFFATDFNRFLSVDRTVEIKIENPATGFQGATEVKTRLFRDFDNNAEFFAMYLPFLNDARMMSAIEGIIENVRPNLKQLLQEAKLIEIGTQSPGGGFIRSGDLVFSGRVFLYTINALDPVQIGRLVQSYRNDGMYLEIRGQEYLYYHSKR